MGRMRGEPEEPAGLLYRPDLLTAAEERDLLAALAGYDFQQVVLHGQAARRTVCHFGIGYEFETARAVPGAPLPAELVGLRATCAAWAGVQPERLVEALVTRYPPGATIGWHRDAPVFGAPGAGRGLYGATRVRLIAFCV